MTKKHDDSELWAAYHDAVERGKDAHAKRIAGDIVEFHLGFIRMYAKQTAFPQWGPDEHDDYLQELVLAALAKVPHYDLRVTGRNGKRAQFVTYLRHSLQAVRWKVEVDRQLIKQSVETRRLKAALEQWFDEESALRDVPPSDEEIADYLTNLMGKQKHPIGPAQVRRLRAQPVITRPDEDMPSSQDRVGTGWDSINVGDPSPEDLVVAADEEKLLSARVADALQAAGLTDLEKVLVAERLMAPPKSVLDGEVVSPGPRPYRDIATRFSTTVAEVRAVEEGLILRLRDLLS